MTSAEPGGGTSGKRAPAGPRPADTAALCDALSVEHATIYGYGVVSAMAPGSVNAMVTEALAQHRQRRDDVITMLTARSVSAPVAAAGYQLPLQVNSPADAVRLAVRMENDGTIAWRTVIERAETAEDRAFASTALTQSAVMAARWNKVLGAWPITAAFPGGSE